MSVESAFLADFFCADTRREIYRRNRYEFLEERGKAAIEKKGRYKWTNYCLLQNP